MIKNSAVLPDINPQAILENNLQQSVNFTNFYHYSMVEIYKYILILDFLVPVPVAHSLEPVPHSISDKNTGMMIQSQM